MHDFLCFSLRRPEALSILSEESGHPCSTMEPGSWFLLPLLYLIRIFGTDKGYRKLKALKRYDAEPNNKQTSPEKH